MQHLMISLIVRAGVDSQATIAQGPLAQGYPPSPNDVSLNLNQNLGWRNNTAQQSRPNSKIGALPQIVVLPKEADGLLIQLQLPLDSTQMQEMKRIVIAKVVDEVRIENPRRTIKLANRTNSKSLKKKHK